MNIKKILYISLLLGYSTYSQSLNLLEGLVKDDEGVGVFEVTVNLKGTNIFTITDKEGKFKFDNVERGKYIMEFDHMNFDPLQKEIDLEKDLFIEVIINEKLHSLEEITISGNKANQIKRRSTQSIQVVNNEYLLQNRGGSLMESLSNLPGVDASSIGSGQSKPVIRGFSFNRVAIIDNGVKYQGQQWGVDHGLEMDQFAIKNVQIIKGPQALIYGSDAIGGLIDLSNHSSREANSFGADIDLNFKSVNNSYSSSAELYKSFDKLQLSLRYTLEDFSDFKIPTNQVVLYNWIVPLEENKVRNTAGTNDSFHFNLEYLNSKFINKNYFGITNSKSGFFANASGLEPLNADEEIHDKSNRDIIDLYQSSNHLKFISENNYLFNDSKNSEMSLKFGFQKNHRQEFSPYYPHSNQPQDFPSTVLGFPENLDKDFKKSTITTNFLFKTEFQNNSEINISANYENQQNRVEGVNFLIPSFNQNNFGMAFIYDKELDNYWKLNVGVRYDIIDLNIFEHSLWYDSSEMVSKESDFTNNNMSWSIGTSFIRKNITFKSNLGSGFRAPLAQELGSYGFNRHFYRNEFGNSNLSAEKSYQLDFEFEYKSRKFAIELTPFGNYFPNYIYLNPSYHSENVPKISTPYLQPFYYEQAKVIRLGGEFHSHYEIIDKLDLELVFEYIFAEQLSGPKKGFTLPFSPPATTFINVVKDLSSFSIFRDNRFRLNYQIAFDKDNIVPSEKKTPGYSIFNLAFISTLKLGKQKMNLTINLNNVFDKKYLKHSSYYRIIDMPEPGINLMFNLKIPITL